jgi:hypothetical protein
VAAASDSAVDFENQAVLLDRHFSDLDLVADAGRRPILFPDLRPLITVVVSVDIEIQGLFRAGKVVLDRGKFGVKAAKKFDPFLLREIGCG